MLRYRAHGKSHRSRRNLISQGLAKANEKRAIKSHR